MTEVIKQKTKTLALNQSINYFLIGFIFVILLLYAYFTNVAVRTLTGLEKTKTAMQSLSITVSELESKRLSMENDISSNLAEQFGLVEINNPTFVLKNSQKATLSLKMD